MKHHFRFREKYSCFLYEIDNLGINNALSVQFSVLVNGKILFKEMISCIRADEQIKLMFLVDKSDFESDDFDITLDFTYKDVCSLGKYKQREILSFRYFDKAESIILKPKGISEPKEIN